MRCIRPSLDHTVVPPMFQTQYHRRVQASKGQEQKRIHCSPRRNLWEGSLGNLHQTVWFSKRQYDTGSCQGGRVRLNLGCWEYNT